MSDIDVGPKTTKAHCPTCDGERTCLVHGEVNKPWDYEDRQGNSAHGAVDHSLLECRGCETVFYESAAWNSEDVDLWNDAEGNLRGEHPRERLTYPKPEGKTKPVWLDAMAKIDRQLHGILNEMYMAYDNQAFILTAVGLRTALDRGMEVLGIDPSLTFAEKLTALRDGGWIGETEKDILEVVTDAGNAAAHRGWSPDNQEITQLVYAMEVFLQRAFIVGKKALGIKAAIPAKPARRKKATPTTAAPPPASMTIS